MDAATLLLLAAIAAGVSAAATPLVGRVARAAGVVDKPSERTVSERANMPLMGGLAVALGFAAAAGLGLYLLGEAPTRGHVGALGIGGALMLLCGVYDDRFGMGAWQKFSVQLVAAAIAIAGGFTIGHFTDPISRTSTFLPDWASWTITVLWILGITNAVNLIDGLDGLATGVGAIIGLTLTVICWQGGMALGVVIGVALVGALLGFLPFNFSPARIFLGDTGSLFVGYSLSLLALEGYRQMTVLTFVVPLLALAFPILDTGLSIIRRLRRGVPVFAADRHHMHHRLLASAGSHQSACLQVYWVTGAFCLLAVSFTKLQGIAAAACLLMVAVLTIRLLRNLGVFAAEGDEPVAPDGALHGND